MDNKCPKCSEKLSIFYLKPNCPHCGCDILNYNMKKRLEEDAEKAEAEYEQLDKLLNRFRRNKSGKKADKYE